MINLEHAKITKFPLRIKHFDKEIVTDTHTDGKTPWRAMTWQPNSSAKAAVEP